MFSDVIATSPSGRRINTNWAALTRYPTREGVVIWTRSSDCLLSSGKATGEYINIKSENAKETAVNPIIHSRADDGDTVCFPQNAASLTGYHKARGSQRKRPLGLCLIFFSDPFEGVTRAAFENPISDGSITN